MGTFEEEVVLRTPVGRFVYQRALEVVVFIPKGKRRGTEVEVAHTYDQAVRVALKAFDFVLSPDLYVWLASDVPR